MSAHESLLAVDYGMKESAGNPDEPYFYLGGPMTGIPEFNFPRFFEVQEILYEKGYNVISPADLEKSNHDDGSGSYTTYMERDFIICSLPQCVGGIFLEGWEKSRGARGETWVLQFLKKPIYQYRDGRCGADRVELDHIDRDEHLYIHSIENDGVPKDHQGLLTSGVASSGVVPNKAEPPLSNGGPVMHSSSLSILQNAEEHHDALMWGGKI